MQLERTRTYRGNHKLAIRIPLPQRKISMFSIKTKENLIKIISLTLMEKVIAKKIETKLVITSKDEFPVETKLGVRIKRRDLKPLFDEEDCIIPHQVD